MIRTAAAFVCVCLVAVPAALSAQSRVTTNVDTTLVTVGDRITMTVSVEHPTGAQVVWPDSVDLYPFEVLDARLAPPTTTPGGARTSAVITVTAFELGELELPSLELEVVSADGTSEMLRTDRFGIEVLSVGADEGGDIRGIRGPLSIPIGVVIIVGWVLILLVLLLLAYVFWRYRRGRGTKAAPAKPRAPPVPAWVAALAALDAVEASQMLPRGEVKEYHIAVSEIVRRYVEERFHVDALEMTTREVMSGLEKARVDAVFRQDLRRFLDQCDMVKFAKARPDADASRALLILGRALIEGSIPVAGATEAPVDEQDPAPDVIDLDDLAPVTPADAGAAALEPSTPEDAAAPEPPTARDAATPAQSAPDNTGLAS
jgi:hypothetical protein